MPQSGIGARKDKSEWKHLSPKNYMWCLTYVRCSRLSPFPPRPVPSLPACRAGLYPPSGLCKHWQGREKEDRASLSRPPPCFGTTLPSVGSLARPVVHGSGSPRLCPRYHTVGGAKTPWRPDQDLVGSLNSSHAWINISSFDYLPNFIWREHMSFVPCHNPD